MINCMSIDTEFVALYLTVRRTFVEEPQAKCIQVLKWGERSRQYLDVEGKIIDAQKALELLVEQVSSKLINDQKKSKRYYNSESEKNLKPDQTYAGIIEDRLVSRPGVFKLSIRYGPGIVSQINLDSDTFESLNTDFEAKESLSGKTVTVCVIGTRIMSISPYYAAWNSTMSSSSKT